MTNQEIVLRDLREAFMHLDDGDSLLPEYWVYRIDAALPKCSKCNDTGWNHGVQCKPSKNHPTGWKSERCKHD